MFQVKVLQVLNDFFKFSHYYDFCTERHKSKIISQKEGELLLSDIMVFYFFPGRSSNLPALPWSIIDKVAIATFVVETEEVKLERSNLIHLKETSLPAQD